LVAVYNLLVKENKFFMWSNNYFLSSPARPYPDPCRQPSCAWLHWRFECDRKIFGWM